MRGFQVCFEGKDPLDRQLIVCVLKKNNFPPERLREIQAQEPKTVTES